MLVRGRQYIHPLLRPVSRRTPAVLSRAMALFQPPAAAAPTKDDGNGDEKLIVGGVPVAPRAGQFLQHEADGGLRRRDLDPRGPVAQFHAWFAQAAATPGLAHPETVTLSTASLPSGRVSARMVYLKELDRRGGFVVYSNFGTSRKAADLFGAGDGTGTVPNPWVALTFYWEPQARQVRVEGRAARLSPAASQAYYDSRVRGSRIGAWASRQSAVLAGGGSDDDDDDGRAQLDRWVAEAEQRFGASADPDTPANHIPVPPFWGGLRIVPERIEFWQGRANRLHDRFVYDRVRAAGDADGPVDVDADVSSATWTVERLSP